MDKNELLTQLQALRLKLHEMAEARGNLTDPDVIAISEEADRVIIVLQRMHLKETASPNHNHSKFH